MPKPKNSTTVLLIEDDCAIRDVAALRLRAAGYSTIDAGDGVDGIHKANTAHPDAIVLDIRMPRKDGMTVLAELKDQESTRCIPIVMLSASIVDQQRALEVGADFFLSKPYSGRDLLATVSAAIDNQAKRGTHEQSEDHSPR